MPTLPPTDGPRHGADASSAAADSPSPWQWWRDQMPVARRWAYLDHAAVAPLPGPAADRLAELARILAEEGDTRWMEWAGELEEMRGGLARYLGADADEIALIPNTTFGINIVAEGFPWRDGDNVVIPGGEFPSNHFPWENQQRRGVELRVVPSPAGRVDLDGIRRAIDGRTRIVAASWVGYASGYRLPVEDLCELAHRRGALVFLDAIQGLGPFSLDLSRVPVDFLAADGHKWLLGPEGAGVAFIRKRHLDTLACASVGWNSVVGGHTFSNDRFELRPSAARFEGGTANVFGLLALHASLKILWRIQSEHGPDSVGERVLELHRHAREVLRRRDLVLLSDWQRSNRSGIVTFEPRGGDCPAVRRRLAEAGVAVSCRGGGIRLSMHAYNTPEDLDRVVDALP